MTRKIFFLRKTNIAGRAVSPAVRGYCHIVTQVKANTEKQC